VAYPVTVLVLTPSVGGQYYGELLAGLVREVARAGGRVVLVQTQEANDPSDEQSEASDFATRVAWSEVDGVVSVTTAVSASYLQQLRDAGKPVVLASSRLPGFEAPVALPDNQGGTVAAVEHLIAHGHTRIGFVGNIAQPDVSDRYAAYLQTLAAHELQADPALVFAAPNNSWSGGVRAADDVLGSPDRPTALMVATDQNAIGLMSVLTDAGLAIPGDIAVMGFDNIEESAFSTPTLSSVNQRFDEVGALAGRLVLAQIRGEVVAVAPHVLSAASIVLRDSCGCATSGLGNGIAGRDGSLDSSPEFLRDELQDTLCGLLLTGRSEGDDPVRDAVTATVREAERLLQADSQPTSAEIQWLAASLRRLTPHPDVLRRITGAVLGYLRRGAAALALVRGSETVGAGLGQLAAALWQVQAGAFLRQAQASEAALVEQYAVADGLLDAGRSDPRHLDWLDETHVRAGALALWDDDRSSGRLWLTGTYDPERLFPGVIGAAVTPEHFPPAPLIAAAHTADLGVCIVVPVRTKDRDWGLLTVVGEINTTSAVQTYQHWVAQLCASFEEQGLQEAVREREERYALAARATNDGLWEWDLRTWDFYMSDRCCTMLGLEPDPGADRLAQLLALVHPDDLSEMRRGMRSAAIGQQETTDSEYRIRTADGSYRWVLARELGVRPEGRLVERVVGSLSDIHERRSLEDQLRENALYDALTGLPNRRLFLLRLEHAVSLWHRSKTPFAVIFLDLDGFKTINDSFGHQMGDRVLNAVGARIKGELRAVDTGSRFGGDEFAILLHDVDPLNVLTVARRYQRSLAELIDLDGHEFTIGASLGVATSAIEYASAEDVLRDADTAMYHAKETEPGTASLFDAAMHARAVHQMQLSAEIRRALDQGQFEMHYQPIVDLVTGRADRFEALVRWRHPERGLILPGEFLPVMEETGLIVQLGRWIINEVCRQLAAWGPDVANVAVNVSDREFWNSDLLAHVLQSLKRHGLTPDRMTLEITESVIMHRPEVALHLMREMHAAGIQLHIDDFGTGHSSLSTLQRFPVDAFKIDRSFIHALKPGSRTDELVRAIIAMGKALDVAVVAEGIETEEQLKFMQEIGCATGQGFLFMPAVSAENAPDLIGRVLGGEHPDEAVPSAAE
jgi:diguanylate cyclase (GGDEF)-like protein/PAS domain S-box-containing protein